jgi:anti-anti-sigma factor
MNGPVVLKLSGEVDIAVVDSLREAWYATAEQDGARPIVVDLTEVTFIDASGLGLLVGIWKRRHCHGGQVCLRGVPPPVRTLLQLTGLLGVFTLEHPLGGDLDDVQQHHGVDLADSAPHGTGHALSAWPLLVSSRTGADEPT